MSSRSHDDGVADAAPCEREGKGGNVTRAEPTELEELSARVLGIIGAYEMGAALEARKLNPKIAPAATPPQPVLVPGEVGSIRDGVYHLAR